MTYFFRDDILYRVMVKVIKYDEIYKSALLTALKSELSSEKLNALNDFLLKSKTDGTVWALVCLNEDETPIGYATGELLPRGEEKITDIFVLKNFRRQGVGSVILVSAFYYATMRLSLRISADCPKQNEAATAFFGARTFTKTAENENFVYFIKSLLPMYNKHEND